MIIGYVVASTKRRVFEQGGTAAAHGRRAAFEAYGGGDETGPERGRMYPARRAAAGGAGLSVRPERPPNACPRA